MWQWKRVHEPVEANLGWHLSSAASLHTASPTSARISLVGRTMFVGEEAAGAGVET
jgi:hypothetical protein